MRLIARACIIIMALYFGSCALRPEPGMPIGVGVFELAALAATVLFALVAWRVVDAVFRAKPPERDRGALVACPDCAHRVSTEAAACPACGRAGPFFAPTVQRVSAGPDSFDERYGTRPRRP